jgi:predicted permease
MGRMLQDVRHAVKGLARKPFFTALAGVTLAIGIGANTAIYSVVDSVLLNPLPYPDSDRVVTANHTAPGLNVPILPYSEGMYLTYHQAMTTLESMAVFQQDNVNLVLGSEPERLASARVTEDFFDVLGVAPALGRAIGPGDDREGAEPIAVLSNPVWRQTFGADPSVIGRTVEMDGVARTIVGVMPEGFAFPQDVQMWVPLPIDDLDPNHGSFSYIGIGRVAQGASVEAVNLEMDELLVRFAQANEADLPASVLEQARIRADAKPLMELYVADVRQALWVVLGTVGFVLLIACANVANLFLVRAEARQREQAVRTAMGATRGDMVRFYLTESVALGLGAGVLGLMLAGLGVRALLSAAPTGLPRATEVGMDGSVLAYTAVVSVVAGLLFGLFPVFGYGRRDLSGALKEGGRSSTTGRARSRLQGGLVVGQVALALVLLVGSGLMARSFAAIRSVDPGFQAEGRLTFTVSLPSAEYPDVEDARVFYRALTERLRAVPGVEGAAIASAMPLTGNRSQTSYQPSDRPLPDGELGPLVRLQWASPDYFEVMGIEMVEGRPFTDQDAADVLRSVVVNEAMARQFWPGEASVVGRRIRGMDESAEEWEVVGVARDVHFESLSEEPDVQAYFPLVSGDTEDPVAQRSLALVVRGDGDPSSLLPGVRQALRDVAPRLPIVDPRPLSRIVDEASAATSFTVVLLGIAAAIALLLGAVGIYGVISYVVGRRTQEIGVRMALGAPAGVVLRDVIGHGMLLAGGGVAVGLVGAWATSRVLESLLFGVSATDPATYAAMAGALTAVALVASWFPARRAARLDPVRALRSE